MQSSGEYGGNKSQSRACQNCSKAKARCITQLGSQDKDCARCSRLKKECVPVVRSVRKRRSPNTVSKTTQLEQKLESLVNLLSTTRGIAPSPDQPTPPDSQGQSEPSPSNEVGPLARPHASEQPWAPGLPIRDVAGPFDARCAAFTSAACAGACGIQPDAAPTPHSPPNASFDRLLRLFKQKHAPHFPFVIIPSDVSASQLHVQKPWLLRVVVFVACQENRVQQLEMSKAYLLDISAAMLLRGEKSLDMLQSLIIYNAWSYTHGHVKPSSHSTGIFQLAVGMAFDLGLTKQYREIDSPSEVLMHTINEGVPLVNRREMRRSFDEMRALLCCYVLTTVTTCFIKKIEGLLYSPYIDHCCQDLLEAGEYESDFALIAMVKLQMFVERIFATLNNRLNTNELKAPIWMQMKSIRADLTTYWQSLSLDVKENLLVLSTYQSTEIFLYEPCLYKWLFTTTQIESNNNPRLDMLYACLISTKTLLDHYISQPDAVFLAHCCIDLAHMGFGISTLMRLTLVEENGWDLVEVRQTANITFYFDQFIQRLEDAGKTIDQQQTAPCRQSFPTGCSKAMKKVSMWYDTVVPRCGEQIEQQEPFLGTEGLFNDDVSGYLNDNYWLDFMGSQEFMQTL